MSPLAVVTGASSGIGYELAEQFAEHDFDVIVAAEDDAIRGAGAELDAEAVQVDLATEAGVEELYRRIGGRADMLDTRSARATARTTRPTWPATGSRR